MLIIRGEWDQYPDHNDAHGLFQSLENAAYKKYVQLQRGTHVMHLEKERHHLYREVLNFLQERNVCEESSRQPVAVIFEVLPAEGQQNNYLKTAAQLRAELEKTVGFISVERFQSITDKNKILSLSFWQSEQAVEQWRNAALHRKAQAEGRSYVFQDYRLRVARIMRDYGKHNRIEAPEDSNHFHRIDP